MRHTIDNVNKKGGCGSDDDPDAVLDLVHTLMHQVRAQQYQALQGGDAPLTHMEAKVLGFFGRHPGGTQSDLALHSGRDKAQLARLVKGLRERGLLDGEADPADKRNLRLRVSEAGQALLQALNAASHEVSQRAMAGFSAAELAQLQALLRRVRANLDGAA
ncbi:DNA-binding MarR family transcriptional regulator [Sphaerotilus hippei]|uniref:DNA-binding MarR family transcriptional regulator n=1 Tax=Sphaerotilus hippei TaxID=744406 RepID=A0A318H2R7_9BURK|nr:MarR family transcriptional regulator [Sphaerotilus hippei]PXW97629.1 DNA-binding MarR family transcriptional regulator [Sphaerotilus hippei]